MIQNPASLASIYRYPVKGLTPEKLPRVALTAGQTLPSDRRYAVENGPSGFDPAAPRHLPKSQFLMLMRNERLAALRTHYDDASHTLTIRENGAETARGDLETREGRAAIEAFFAANFADELRGPPRILVSPGHSFSDVAKRVASIINLASVAALEDVIGRPVHPLRFRGNLHVAGWPAWHEFDLMDRVLRIGEVRLKVVKRIVRCAATNVDPDTAARDLTIPATLMRTYGHADLGVYAEVISDGMISEGDAIEVVAPVLV
ncbi:MOSC domain-containing protein [Tardiphaga sp.]|uniref:MOSC domain-containing protein n=1 Tax=Tardiphaga sp. TaxID=1926292 RepID=UPI0025F97AF6|nr:MOSC domain-containing protein [Tardiphaga sp.]